MALAGCTIAIGGDWHIVDVVDEWTVCCLGWKAGEFDGEHHTGAVGTGFTNDRPLNGTADVWVELCGW